MRRGWALALLAACATERGDAPHAPPEPPPAKTAAAPQGDDIAGEVRRFVAEHWSEAVARGLELPDAQLVDVRRLECDEETSLRGWQGEGYGFLSVVARGDAAEVVLVDCGNRYYRFFTGRLWPNRPRAAIRCRTPDGQYAEDARAWRGTIPRAEFDRLIRKVVLLQGAELRGKPADGLRRWAATHSSVRLDRHPPTETKGWCGDTNALDDDARAVLVSMLVWGEARDWTYEDVLDPDTVAATLLRDLETVPISWRRPARVKALGLLGCAAAIPVLEKLEPRGEDIDEALTRIRLLRECKHATTAPASLVDLATRTSERSLLQIWALEVFGQRFPTEYRAWLCQRFEAEDPNERSEALAELRAYDPADLTLARRACDDPDPGLRLEGAVRLGDQDRLLALARDAAVPLQERLGAIDALTRSDRPASLTRPDRQVVGETLIALLDDPAYVVRRAAAAGIGALGFQEGVPALLRAMLAALSSRRGGDAADFACALGQLGSRDAVEPIDRALQGGSPSTFWYRACFGLATISDPRVRPILEREREKRRPDPRAFANWHQSIAIHEKVRRDHARSILDAGRKSGCDVSKDIADRFTADELRALGVDLSFAEHRPILERALAMKEGPG